MTSFFDIDEDEARHERMEEARYEEEWHKRQYAKREGLL
jgi:hypothetical protein